MEEAVKTGPMLLRVLEEMQQVTKERRIKVAMRDVPIPTPNIKLVIITACYKAPHSTRLIRKKPDKIG